MKVVNVVLLIAFLSACDVASQNKGTTNKANHETSIKAVIEAETTAFVNRDSSLLMSYYTDDDITQSAWNQPDGSYGLFKRLENIKNNFRSAFKANPERQHMPDVKRSDWFFRPLSEEWMWVNFTQTITLTDGTKYTSYETRIMKKIGNEWKIAVMYALSDHGLSSDKSNSTP